MSGLNAEQAAAASALAGRVIIRAGAGTGKTKTLTERFVNALEAPRDGEMGDLDIEDVLTITFTDKAAGEIADRVRRALRARGRRDDALRVDAAWIGTIHGACSRILRQSALAAGLDPRFAVVGAVDDRRLKERSFEEAMTAVLQTPQGERLVSAYGWAELFQAVERLSRIRRTSPDHVETSPASRRRSPLSVWEKAVALFAGSAEAMEACGAPGMTPKTFSRSCRTIVESLRLVDIGALAPADAFLQVYEALDTWRAGRGMSHDGAAEIRSRLSARCLELMDEAAEGIAAELEEALIELADRYEANYQTAKRDRSLLDFDDLQVEVARLLAREPCVPGLEDVSWDLVMIDEFQDTDALQIGIIERVAGKNLCTVGDEYQSIYGFRGADIEVYRAHNESMREHGAREFELRTNYRSHPQVLGFVNKVFSSSGFARGSLVQLEAGRIEPDPPVVPEGEPRIDIVAVEACAGSDSARETEAASVASRFARLRDEFGVDPGDMVVLTRAYTHAHHYAAALRRQGFEVSVAGGGSFLSAPEVLACRALLKAIANPRDEAALAEVLASDVGGVSDDALYRLRRAVREDGLGVDLWDALEETERVLVDTDLATAARVRETIVDARRSLGRKTLPDVLLASVERCGLRDTLDARGPEGVRALANVFALARMAREFEGAGGAGPAAFARYLDDRERFGEHTPGAVVDGSSDVVRIMSIHASKGLEFPVVALVETGSVPPADRVMVRVEATDGRLSVAVRPPLKGSKGLSDGLSPGYRELDGRQSQAGIEEAKRLFYVGCTRAREVLIVSGTVKAACESPSQDPKTTFDRLRVALPGLIESVPVDREPVVAEVDALSVRVQAVSGVGGEDEPHGVFGESPVRADTGRVESESAPTPKRRVASDVVRRVSYTDLALFERCERRYLLERRLRVGAVDVSDTGRSATRFGSAVHAALQLMDEARSPSPARLAAIATQHRLDEPSRIALSEAVEAFANSRAARDLYSTGVVSHEWAFVLRLGDEGEHVDLHGSLDAYKRDGDHGLIVDYKTGTSGDEKQLAARYRLQARCYALVALSQGCSSVDVVFCRPQVVDEDGEPQQVRFSFGSGDAAEIQDEILGIWRRIEKSEGEPLARWDRALCGDCRHSGALCPRVPGREGRSAR